MKYDQTDLPAGYDRARDHGLANLELWMDAVQQRVLARPLAWILDLGCGTGRFAGGLASWFDATVIGMDPSSRMLRQAQAKGHAGVDCVQAAAEAIPLRTRSVDMVRIPEYPYVPFFPTALPILDEVLPDVPSIRAAFADAGFDLASAEIVPQTIAPDWSAYADKLAAGGDSVLARLDQHEMAAGLERVRRHAQAAGSEAIIEPIDMLVFELRV